MENINDSNNDGSTVSRPRPEELLDPDTRYFTPLKASEVALEMRLLALHTPVAKMMDVWRQALRDVHLELAAQRLGVPADFLREFRPGWVADLGALAIETLDEDGISQGIEAIGVRVPADVELDRCAIVGDYGHIAPVATARPGAPLAVSSDFGELHSQWKRGANVGWRCGDSVGMKCLASVENHAARIKASKVIHLGDARRCDMMCDLVQAARRRVLDMYRRRRDMR